MNKYRINLQPNEPPHRSKFVLTANGYHGDADYYFKYEEAVEPDDTDMLDWLLAGFDLLARLKRRTGNGPSSRDEEPLLDHPGVEHAPMDTNGERFAKIEGFALTWWNANGVPFDVEVFDNPDFAMYD